MEEVLMYKSNNGEVYEKEIDAKNADIRYKFINDINDQVWYRGIEAYEVADWILANYDLKVKDEKI